MVLTLPIHPEPEFDRNSEDGAERRTATGEIDKAVAPPP
jgi:hypothetical protein